MLFSSTCEYSYLSTPRKLPVLVVFITSVSAKVHEHLSLFNFYQHNNKDNIIVNYGLF